MTRSTLVGAATAVILLATPMVMRPIPLAYWNLSESVQTGIYVLQTGLPRRGDLVVVRLPPDVAAFAARRGYLPRGVPLIKPVRATAGDALCRFADHIYMGGKLLIRARRADGLGRPLPSWQGCRMLHRHEVFLLSEHPHGFDGRYFGPIPLRYVIGRVRPLGPLAGKIKAQLQVREKS